MTSIIINDVTIIVNLIIFITIGIICNLTTMAIGRPNCEMTRELTEAILAEVPEAEVEAVEGDEGKGGNILG